MEWVAEVTGLQPAFGLLLLCVIFLTNIYRDKAEPMLFNNYKS